MEVKTQRKTSIFCGITTASEVLLSKTPLSAQQASHSRDSHARFFPMLQTVNWGPKKLNYPYKGIKNALHSCEQMPRMSQMPALWGDPVRNNSCRTLEEQIRLSGTPFTKKPACYRIYLGCHRHQEWPDLTRKDSPSLTDLEVTAGSLQPPYNSSFQNFSVLKNQNCATKWTDTLSPLRHSFLLLFSHVGQVKHPW